MRRGCGDGSCDLHSEDALLPEKANPGSLQAKDAQHL